MFVAGICTECWTASHFNSRILVSILPRSRSRILIPSKPWRHLIKRNILKFLNLPLRLIPLINQILLFRHPSPTTFRQYRTNLISNICCNLSLRPFPLRRISSQHQKPISFRLKHSMRSFFIKFSYNI